MQILEDIGLTKTEAAVYERLLRLGETPVTTLQKSLGVHPQIAYRAVEGLVGKGLAATYRKKNKKFVSPEHPKKLEEMEKERLARLKDALPSLTQLMSAPKDVLVRTSVGLEAIRAFRRMAMDELKTGDALLVISASSDRFYTAMGDEYAELERKRIRKKIWKKMLASPEDRERFERDPFQEHALFRYFSSSHPTISSTQIFGTHVGIIIWATDPILIHIHNHEVATSYRHYFDELWAVSGR